MNEEQKRSYAGRELSPVERAAIKWWKAHRPLDWNEKAHLLHPSVNCMEADAPLALSIAAMVKARKGMS